MFDVGFSELVLLALIGLIVLGPQRLQQVANMLGRWVGKARRTTTQLYRQLERETGLNDVVERPRPKLQVVPRTTRESGPGDRPNA